MEATSETAHIEYVALSELRGAPRNPKDHDLGAIHSSIARFGFTTPVLLDERTGRLVAGHGRLEALRSMKAQGQTAPERIEERDGEWLVPVVRGVRFRSDEDAEGYLLADNRLPELGGWNDSELANILSDLAFADALEGVGWDANEVDEMLAGLDGGQGERGDPDEVPESPVEPVSKRGDVWLLGKHRLRCGDSTVLSELEALMDGWTAQVMWTDPPYGVNYVGKTKDALTIQNDGAGGLTALLYDAFVCVAAVLEPGTPFYIAHPAGALSEHFLAAVREVGWRLHQTLVWVKDSMVLGHSDYHYKHEPILFGYTPGEGRFGRGGKGWYGDNSQVSVFEIARPKASPDHPTGKPVGLIEIHLENSSTYGYRVIDPFGGA